LNDCRHQLAFGPFLLDPVAHDLLRDGESIPLTPKAFDILLVLVENHGRLLDKEELIKAVWPDTFVEEGNLYVMVSILRKIFKDHGYIQTVPKHGYRFVGTVNVLPLGACAGHADVIAAEAGSVSEAQAGALAALPTPVVPSMVPSIAPVGMPGALRPAELADWRAEITHSGSRGGWKFRVPMMMAATAAAVVLAAIALSVLFWSRMSASAQALKSGEIRSLAVLPFENIGAQPGDEYLGLGMADALISKLGSTGKIAARPTRAIQKYQNVSDPRSVGREQNVDAVLDGCIQRSGDRVRVTARLIRVADGMQMWADTFDEDFTNLFAVEDAVSARVVRSIRVELTGEQKERLAKRPTTNNDAYQAYLRGRYFWNERTGEGLKKGLDYFKHAIELDPTYAEAYAGIADSYAMLGLYTVMTPNEAFPKAKAAAIQALQLDSELAEAHATLAFVHFYYDWDGPAAEKEFAIALQEDPNYGMAHSWRGFNFAVMGKFSEAISEATLAQASDPLSAIIGTNAGWVYFLAGQSDKATQILTKVIEIDPNFPRAHFRLGNIYEGEGLYSRAIGEYEKAVQLSDGDTYYLASLGHAYAMAGRYAEAQNSLRHLEELSKKRYVSPYAIALIYVAMGKKDNGLDWLEKASLDRSTSMAYLRVDPVMNSLRSEPRFAVLVKQTNF